MSSRCFSISPTGLSGLAKPPIDWPPVFEFGGAIDCAKAPFDARLRAVPTNRTVTSVDLRDMRFSIWFGSRIIPAAETRDGRLRIFSQPTGEKLFDDVAPSPRAKKIP